MNTLTVDELKQNLETKLDETCARHIPLVISRPDREEVLVMSADDFRRCLDDPGMAETFYVLSSSTNSRRLMESVEQLKRGEVVCPNPAIFEDV